MRRSHSLADKAGHRVSLTDVHGELSDLHEHMAREAAKMFDYMFGD